MASGSTLLALAFALFVIGRLASAVRPRLRRGERMAAFLFRLETVDGEPAEPPMLSAAVSNWRSGDCIYLGRRTLRVVGRRDDDADQPPVLIVSES
jgi:hypothetical protein